MVGLNEIALFVAGGFAWDAVLHLAMVIKGTEIEMFGIHFTPNLNKVLAVTNTIIAILLLWFALA